MSLEGCPGRRTVLGASDFPRLDNVGFSHEIRASATTTLFPEYDGADYQKLIEREDATVVEWEGFEGATPMDLDVSTINNMVHGVGAALSASHPYPTELDVELEVAAPLTPQSKSKDSQKVLPPRSEIAFQARNFQPPPPMPTPNRQPGLLNLQQYDPRYPGLPLQPDSRPISQEQLAAEVKGIYAGLTMVETKCIHVDRAQAAAVASESDSNSNTKLASDHWQALIALHRTLLHEHHDFFLASQHPSASPALRRLASKYSMPARMWKHGIHSFLELLRRRLPESIDYMLAFIYLAYQMMALLYETVPAFEDTWIECLGDLGRYRMAIEDEDIRDRETWAGVASSWYSKAADKNPSVGRLYHHLAILARPNALQQLYYYARSLTCVKPFPSARESILTLLDPILGRPTSSYSHALPIDTSFIQAHGVLFEKLSPEHFKDARLAFQSQLDSHIGRVTSKWKEQGVYIAVTNIAGLFDYGSDDSVLRLILESHYRQIQSKASKHRNEERQAPLRVLEQHYDYPSSLLQANAKGNEAFSSSSLTLTRVTSFLGGLLPTTHVCLSFASAFRSLHSLRVSSCSSLSALVSCLFMLPTASASAIPIRQESSGEKGSVYSDNSIVDWIFSTLVFVYLILAYWLDPKTRKSSLVLSITSATFWVAMVSESDDTFSSSSRWNILKIWAASTVALTCESIKSSIETANRAIPAHSTPTPSCSESATHKFLFQLFGTSALIQVTGMAIQGFGKGSFLKALPPCLSIGVLVTSKINHNTTQYPRAVPSQVSGSPVPADSSSEPNHTRSPSRVAATPHLPNPSQFTLTDDTDLESLASSRLDNVHSRPEAT